MSNKLKAIGLLILGCLFFCVLGVRAAEWKHGINVESSAPYFMVMSVLLGVMFIGMGVSKWREDD